LLINLALVLFITIRAGSEDINPPARATEPLTIRVLDHKPYFPDTLILNDFEKLNDIINMYDQGGEYTLSQSKEHATHLTTSLLIEKVPESNIEMATVHFPRQWDRYDALQLDVYNDSESEGTLWLRIGSQYDSNRFYLKSQKYARSFLLTPGANTITIPVGDIIKAFGRLPQHRSMHFNFPASDGRRYYLDYLRMVQYDSTDE
jgi:hypothetical protein